MITAERIAAAFDGARPGTVGVEEELMLLDPGTLELTPAIEPVLAAAAGDPRFKQELPACQIESTTEPCETVAEVAAALAAARRDLARFAAGIASPAAAGVHPTSPLAGELSRSERYERARSRYGAVLNRQLVFAFQVHVAPGSADAALAVYDALRSYLPALAALSANAPFLEGAGAGAASIRPRISELLPRQGVPPPLASWREYADALAWSGVAEGDGPGAWWWELRPHTAFGTLEIRVPDAQTTLADAVAVTALCHCLVTWLGERAAAGEDLPVDPSWRIAENRWLAARDGLDAELIALDGGPPRRARELIAELVAELEPTAAELGCAAELASVAELLHENGAERQRRIAAEDGIEAVPAWLRDRFLDGC